MDVASVETISIDGRRLIPWAVLMLDISRYFRLWADALWRATTDDDEHYVYAVAL